MAESLIELTRGGIILDDTDMLARVRDLYAITLDRRDEWQPPIEGIYRSSFFKTPTFKYPRPHAIRQARAYLSIHPSNAFGPTAIMVREPDIKVRIIPPQITFPAPLYGIKLPSAGVESDGPFAIERGRYLRDAFLLHEAYPDPLRYVLENDPERLTVQAIVGAAIARFSHAERTD